MISWQNQTTASHNSTDVQKTASCFTEPSSSEVDKKKKKKMGEVTTNHGGVFVTSQGAVLQNSVSMEQAKQGRSRRTEIHVFFNHLEKNRSIITINKK